MSEVLVVMRSTFGEHVVLDVTTSMIGARQTMVDDHAERARDRVRAIRKVTEGLPHNDPALVQADLEVQEVWDSQFAAVDTMRLDWVDGDHEGWAWSPDDSVTYWLVPRTVR